MGIELNPGDRVGDYRLETHLGEGGFGTVWSASHVGSGHRVAVKVLTQFGGARELDRFEREANVLASFEHPNCARFLAFGWLAGKWPYLVMELARGQTLDAWARVPRQLGSRIHVIQQVGAAIDYAHQRGVVHRDLKPSNIMVVDTPSGPLVTVLDFGIAKLVGREQPDITKTGEMLGTPGYMSPEQLRGSRQLGPASDQYSLGVVAFELLSGTALFRRQSMLDTSMAHLVEKPPLLLDVNEHVRNAVDRMLRKDPQERFPSVRAALGAMTPSSSDRRRPHKTDRHNQSSQRRIIVAIIGLVALAALGAWWKSRPAELPVAAPRSAAPSASTVKPVVSSESLSRHAEFEPTCRVLPTGLRRIRVDSAPDVWIYVPPGLESSDARALLVVLRDGGRFTPAHVAADALDGLEIPPQTKADEAFYFASTQWKDIADREGLVVIIPSAKGPLSRRSWDDVTLAENQIRALRADACLLQKPVFLFGEGRGGKAVDEMICRRPDDFSAAIVTAHRYHADETPCERSVAVPMLEFVQTQNKMEPLDGRASRACLNPAEGVWSHTKQHGWRSKQHECDPSGYEIEDERDGECRRYSCDTPLAVCYVYAGRSWPGRILPSGDRMRKCWGHSKSFPYHDVAWEFYEQNLTKEIFDAPQSGCGKATPFIGAGQLRDPQLGDSDGVHVYVPQRYEPTTKTPVVVLFHHDFDGGREEVIDQTGLAEIADRENFVILAPRGGETFAWMERTMIREVDRDFSIVRKNLCVDEERVFAIGHGAGGRAAMWWTCSNPSLAGVATTAYARGATERWCEDEKGPAIPHLHIATLRNRYTPAAGGIQLRDIGTCSLTVPKIALADHEKALRLRNECGADKESFEVSGEPCFRWSECRATLMSCHVDAGARWPGSKPRYSHTAGGQGRSETNDQARCDGKPGDFPMGAVIWKFFEEATQSR